MHRRPDALKPGAAAGLSVLFLMGALATGLWMACFSVTDFNKKVDYHDAGTDACVPVEEQCNLEDDDCDGLVDEGIFEPAGSAPIELLPGTRPSAVYADTNIAALWQWQDGDGPDRARIRFAYLTSEGTPSNLEPLTDGAANYNMQSPVMAFEQGSCPWMDFGIAWIDLLVRPTLCFAVASPAADLPLADADYTRIEAGETDQMASPAVAVGCNVMVHAAAWAQQEGEDASTADIRLAFFDADGALKSEWGPENISLSAGIESAHPAIVRAGMGYVVAWTEIPNSGQSSIHAAYFNAASGEQIGAAAELPVESALIPSRPVLARQSSVFASTTVFLAYQALPSGETNEEIFGVSMNLRAFTEGGGIFSDPVRISHTEFRSVTPSAAWNENAIGVAWSERSTDRRVMFARISSSDFLATCGDLDLGAGQDPSVVSLHDDHQFAVLWGEPEDAGIAMRVIGCTP